MTKIVVLDGYTENPGDLSWDGLKALGDVTVYDRTSYQESDLIAERIGDAEIVVMNKTPISKATIDKCPNIKLIAVLATGYNCIDYNYAREKGIPVVNVPTYGTASVSQYSIALLLEICHHIGYHNESVHAGNWANNADWCYWADVITLHCNLTPENTGMINKDSIARMKDGVILINNARGQLIDEQDVTDALNSGKIAAAGLDVVYTEPIKADNPLLGAKNCIITPHISWAPKESRQRIMDCTVSNIKAFLDGTPVKVVNK